MSGNPREHIERKGFWDGGKSGHSTNSQTAGRISGAPGIRKPDRTGLMTDIDFPPAPEAPPAKR